MVSTQRIDAYVSQVFVTLAILSALGIGFIFSKSASALPLFARQTGQSCLACHAGGQFPELTPYGRLFKLTGYTQGVRTDIPLAVMAVVSYAKVSSYNGSDSSGVDFPRDGTANITTGSVFCCGKITDNIGVFAQYTHDFWASQDASGSWQEHSHIDQVDIRYADRFIDESHDFIYGLSLNNNPGVTDVWNTHNSAFAPVSSYVPAGNAIFSSSALPHDVPATPILEGLQYSAGLSGYIYLNNALYAEVGTYKASTSGLSFLHDAGVGGPGALSTRLSGSFNPYLRLAANHDWNANSLMLGIHALHASVFDDATLISSNSYSTFNDIGMDGQYQYLLDPHALTLLFSFTHENQNYSGYQQTANSFNPSDTLNYLRAKITYVFRARYGASLAYTQAQGSRDEGIYGASPAANTQANLSFNHSPDSKLWVPEVFVMPVQNIRVGLQYFKWSQFLGGQTYTYYSGLGTQSSRNASDNNLAFLYVWLAY